MSETGVRLADLIASGPEAAGQRVEEELKSGDATRSATMTWPLVKSEVVSLLKDALDIDALKIIATAWSKAQELKKYADPAKYPADQSVVVHLGEHNVTCRLQPEIEVLFNEVPVRTIQFNLELVAKFKSAALTIRGGAIRAVSPGSCSAQVMLKYQGVKLKEEQTPEVKFPGRIDLGEGLRIA